MWCLLVTGYRTNGGAELREMYMRVGAAWAGCVPSLLFAWKHSMHGCMSVHRQVVVRPPALQPGIMLRHPANSHDTCKLAHT